MPEHSVENIANTYPRWYRWVRSTIDFFGKLSGWLIGALVIIIFIDVLCRNLFQLPMIWLTELSWHLFGASFLLGAAATLQVDKHVRVDLFYTNFSERTKALVNSWGHVLFLIPWCLCLIWYGSYFAHEAWMDGEGSPDPGGLPARYIIKAMLPLGALLLLLQALVGLYENNILMNMPRKNAL